MNREPGVSPDYCPACGNIEAYYLGGAWRCPWCEPLPQPRVEIAPIGSTNAGYIHYPATPQPPVRGFFTPEETLAAWPENWQPPAPVGPALATVRLRERQARGETIPIVYTAGYQGHTPGALFAAARALRGKVLDIRYMASSPNPDWRHAALVQMFRGRYEHVWQLGNKNYRGNGPIAIDDLEAGLARVLACPHPPILLCACRELSACHRAVVAEALWERGVITRELDWSIK